MINIVSKRNLHVIQNEKKLLVGYLLAGYPQKDSFLKVITNCETAGVDIFELGFPSSDPSSDGEVIKKAHQMVDTSVCSDVNYWNSIRSAVTKPIWVMAYKKDLIDTGFYKTLAEKRLIDALVIPDISFKERQELGAELAPYGVDIVGFVNPEMKDIELEECFSNTALVYQQLYSGPTGMSVISDDFGKILHKARRHKSIKVFAGFGISTPQRVNQLLNDGFDGVIIGTAMINKLNDSVQDLITFINELTATTKKAGGSNEVYSNL
ncbi:MAG TPA: tryptophan synthase subunit alpha [Patescibacteria group bacterium]|nr:tryptophan synthase subunit alpha [Patescibacteria group bacterium]